MQMFMCICIPNYYVCIFYKYKVYMRNICICKYKRLFKLVNSEVPNSCHVFVSAHTRAHTDATHTHARPRVRTLTHTYTYTLYIYLPTLKCMCA